MRRGEVLLLAGLAAMVAVFLLLPAFWAFLAASGLVASLLVLSVGIVYGHAGMVSLCQVTFAGIGAWVVGYLGLHTSWPFPLILLLGALAAVPVGILIGLPALRLRGVNLAVVTLGFAVAASTAVFVRGFPGARTNAPVARPVPFTSERGYLVFVALAFGVTAVGFLVLRRTRLGAAWAAVRHSERATAALGLGVPLTKLSAFATSALVAGVAGGLMAAQTGFLNARNVDPMDSLVVFVVGVFVGAQHLGGALLGGMLTAFFPEFLRRVGLPQDLGPILFALGATQALAQGGRGLSESLRRRRPAPAPTERVVRLADRRLPSQTDPHSRPDGVTLRIEAVTVQFGAVVALDAVDLEVAAGAVTGLIGPNGAGKSTLVDVVTGFHREYTGRVMLGDRAVDRLLAHRRARLGIRRTFQTERTIPSLTTGAYLALAAPHRMEDREVEALLAFVDGPGPDTRIAVMDTGARRRLEIAACLAARPRVVLLDEPAAGLTEEESAQLGERIRQIPERYGSSVLLVEHDIDLVSSVCDEVVVLDFGRVIGRGVAGEVLGSDAVAEAYLGT